MANRAETVAFTGKRPQNLPWGFDERDGRCVCLKQRLDAAIADAIGAGYTHFITGMALGVDIWAAEAVLARRKSNRALTLEAALPCPTQAQRWNAADQRRYEAILRQRDTVTCISPRYVPGCMQARNRYMVDHCQRLIAIADGRSGGTGQTLFYAAHKAVETVIIEVADILPTVPYTSM